jgi:hypothetical protein
MGMTHDGRNSKTGKSDAISKTFQRMTFPRRRDSYNRKSPCLMICKNAGIGAAPSKPAQRFEVSHRQLWG